MYQRGLQKYPYYFGVPYAFLVYNGPQNPILIIKAPVLYTLFEGFRSLWVYCVMNPEDPECLWWMLP